jgi:hypothetical protein
MLPMTPDSKGEGAKVGEGDWINNEETAAEYEKWIEVGKVAGAEEGSTSLKRSTGLSVVDPSMQ